MGRRDFYQEEKIKKYVYVFSITLVLSIVVFLTIFVMYNKKMKKESNMALENLGTIEDIVSNDNLTETTSMSSDLTAKEASSKKENKVDTKVSKNEIKSAKVSKTPVESTVTNSVTNATAENKANSIVENTAITENTEESLVVEELKFEAKLPKDIEELIQKLK